MLDSRRFRSPAFFLGLFLTVWTTDARPA